MSTQSQVYTAANNFKRKLAINDDKALNLMISHYKEQYKFLRPKFDKFIKRIEDAKAAGTPLKINDIIQSQQYKLLIEETTGRLDIYLSRAGKIIKSQQLLGITQGVDDAYKMLNIALPIPNDLKNDIHLYKLNSKSFENMIGTMENGEPIDKLLSKIPQTVSNEIKQTMLIGIETGIHPATIAKLIDRTLGSPLQNTMTVCRTEYMRAYRKTAHDTYLQNERVLNNWAWKSGTNSCLACLLMNGTIHPLKDNLESHPRCRCIQLPITKTWKELFPNINTENIKETRIIPEKGIDEFKKFSKEKQKQLLGPTKYKMYEDGKLNLDNLVKIKSNSTWGDNPIIRPIKEL